MTIPLTGAYSDAVYSGPLLLRHALVVVQFSAVLKIADRTGAGIAQFQDELRATYPNLKLDVEQNLRVEFRPDAGLQPSMQEVPVWRLSDTAQHWQVSLTTESVALEVKGANYSNWNDFSARLDAIVGAVQRHFEPSQRLRLGVRYANGAALDENFVPRDICASELTSITGLEGLREANLFWRFEVDEGELVLRSGVVPAGVTYDPVVLAPTDGKQWFLDVDVINAATEPFQAEAVTEATVRQVRRAHDIYRWAMRSDLGRRA